MPDLLWGCDPEFFAGYKDDLSYDKFLSHKMFAYSPAACEKWNGLKPIMDDPKHPWYFNYKTPMGIDANVVGDGVAFELNFNAPFKSTNEFYHSVKIAKEKLGGSLSKFGYSVFDQPVINFDYQKFWTSELMEDPKFMMGVIFGCDPDQDAFDTQASCQILDASHHPYRYGGGHIHISGDDAIEKNPIPFVMLLGLTLGNYCIANSTHLEGEQVRAKYYGKPGKHRIQKYKNGMIGVEYRTPSNEWTTWTQDRFEGMFDQVRKALDLLKNPAKGKAALADYAEATKTAVTTANVQIANSVLRSI